MNQLLVIDLVSVRRDQDGRYCLNDFHRQLELRIAIARTAGPEPNPSTAYFLS